VDWRDGWEGGRVAPGRTSDVFCELVRAAVARSRGAGTHCHRDDLQSEDPHLGWLLACVHHARPSLKEQLYLIYTPAYDPEAKHTPMAQAASRDGS
jgi:DNA-binding transcriptional LysR family regulator